MRKVSMDLMVEFEVGLERLRLAQESIQKDLQFTQTEEEVMEESAVPRGVIPEDEVQPAELPTFQVLGTDFGGGSIGIPEASVSTSASWFKQLEELQQVEPVQKFSVEIPETPAPSPIIPSPVSTPASFSLQTTPAPSPLKAIPIFRPGFGEDESRQQSIKVSAVPKTPEAQIMKEAPSIPGETMIGTGTNILPIVQAPGLLSSQRERIVREMYQAPEGKTHLIPWNVAEDPEELVNMVRWAIETLIHPGDAIRIMISGEASGKECFDGFVSHFITNETFAKEKEALRQAFPRLVDTVEKSGLDSVPFQIEIRRGESLGWSLRQELMWPHVENSMVILIPSHIRQYRPERDYDPSAEPTTFEEEVLQASRVPVLQYKV